MTAPPAWPGLPVMCGVCLQNVTPVMTDDGWRLPVHQFWPCRDRPTCVGSLAGVDRPVHDTMARRIEEHVVSAMPPAHIPPELMKGPR